MVGADESQKCNPYAGLILEASEGGVSYLLGVGLAQGLGASQGLKCIHFFGVGD